MRFGKTFTTYQLAKKLGAKPSRGHLQARRGGCLADRSGVPRRLRRLAVPSRTSGNDPPRSTREAGRLLRLLPGSARPGRAGNIKTRTSGYTRSTGTSWSSTSITSAHGVTPPRSCSKARTTLSPRRRPSSSTPADLEDVNEDLGELSENETDFLPITTRLPVPFRYAVQGAGYRRVHRGADLQLDLHRRAARQGGVRARSIQAVEPLRRAAADAPADLPDARRAAGDRERWRVR